MASQLTALTAPSEESRFSTCLAAPSHLFPTLRDVILSSHLHRQSCRWTDTGGKTSIHIKLRQNNLKFGEWWKRISVLHFWSPHAPPEMNLHIRCRENEPGTACPPGLSLSPQPPRLENPHPWLSIKSHTVSKLSAKQYFQCSFSTNSLQMLERPFKKPSPPPSPVLFRGSKPFCSPQINLSCEVSCVGWLFVSLAPECQDAPGS